MQRRRGPALSPAARLGLPVVDLPASPRHVVLGSPAMPRAGVATHVGADKREVVLHPPVLRTKARRSLVVIEHEHVCVPEAIVLQALQLLEIAFETRPAEPIEQA